jgi:hypothetical protein
MSATLLGKKFRFLMLQQGVNVVTAGLYRSVLSMVLNVLNINILLCRSYFILYLSATENNNLLKLSTAVRN